MPCRDKAVFAGCHSPKSTANAQPSSDPDLLADGNAVLLFGVHQVAHPGLHFVNNKQPSCMMLGDDRTATHALLEAA